MLLAQPGPLRRSPARAHRKEQRAGADLEALVETCPVGVLVLDAASGVSLSLIPGGTANPGRLELEPIAHQARASRSLAAHQRARCSDRV